MIHIISNNAGSKKDGIGDYSKNLFLALKRIKNDDVYIHTAFSGTNGIVGKLFSMKMSKLFDNVCNQIGQRDVVVIEYPFAECNIQIVYYLKKLRAAIVRKQATLILSLHEYERVNGFRKYIIKCFLASSDVVLVTNKKTKSMVSKITRVPIFFRTIPSNVIVNSFSNIVKDKRVYVYFGLITKAKAIDEMLRAWAKFNVDNRNTLYFLTSSSFENHYENMGVHFMQNLENEDVANYFRMASFCVLPIIPCVSEINASYKTALLYNCIPIGHFDEDISYKQSYINMNGNDEEDFLQAFWASQNLKDSEYNRRISVIKKLPHPTFENTAKEYLDVIRQFRTKENK